MTIELSAWVEPRRASLSWALGLTIVAVLGCGGPPLHLAVTYQDVQELEVGDEVVYKGLEIGTVTAVGVDEAGNVRVDFLVRRDYRSAVAERASPEPLSGARPPRRGRRCHRWRTRSRRGFESPRQ